MIRKLINQVRCKLGLHHYEMVATYSTKGKRKVLNGFNRSCSGCNKRQRLLPKVFRVQVDIKTASGKYCAPSSSDHWQTDQEPNMDIHVWKDRPIRSQSVEP